MGKFVLLLFLFHLARHTWRNLFSLPSFCVVRYTSDISVFHQVSRQSAAYFSSFFLQIINTTARTGRPGDAPSWCDGTDRLQVRSNSRWKQKQGDQQFMELDRKRRHRPTSHVPLLIPHSGAIVDVFLFIEHIMSSSYIAKKKKKKLFFSLSPFSVQSLSITYRLDRVII